MVSPPPPLRVGLVRSAGRLPFCGHARGRLGLRSGEDTARLYWSARARHAGTAAEGWAAAEALRAAMAGLGSRALPGEASPRFLVIDAAWAALRELGFPDLVALLVGEDAGGLALSAAGLAMVHADDAPLVPRNHPLLGEPGAPDRVGYFHAETRAAAYVGLPLGVGGWTGSMAEACGPWA